VFELQEKETQNIGQTLKNLKAKIENCPGPNVPQKITNEINIVKLRMKRASINFTKTKVK